MKTAACVRTRVRTCVGCTQHGSTWLVPCADQGAGQLTGTWARLHLTQIAAGTSTNVVRAWDGRTVSGYSILQHDGLGLCTTQKQGNHTTKADEGSGASAVTAAVKLQQAAPSATGRKTVAAKNKHRKAPSALLLPNLPGQSQ